MQNSKVKIQNVMQNEKRKECKKNVRRFVRLKGL